MRLMQRKFRLSTPLSLLSCAQRRCLTHSPLALQVCRTRAFRGCRPAFAESTAIASCAGKPFNLKPHTPHHLQTPFAHVAPSRCAVASPSSSRAISTRRTPVVSTLPVCKHFTTLHTRTFPCISATHRSLLAVRRSTDFNPVLRSGDVQLYAQRFELPSQSHHALTFTIARAVDALYAYLSTTNYDFNYDRSKNL